MVRSGWINKSSILQEWTFFPEKLGWIFNVGKIPEIFQELATPYFLSLELEEQS